jgi:hypothetical protein
MRAMTVRLVAVSRDRQAVGRADVDAGVALDAELRVEHGLNVAIHAARDFLGGAPGVEAELDLDVERLKRSLRLT